MIIPCGILSFGPRVAGVGSRLTAVTGNKTTLFTLGLWRRRVTVDRAEQVVRIERCACWFFVRRRRIPFEWIAAVTYGYADWSISQWFAQAYNGIDFFSVGLRLKDDTERHLFAFFGEGTFRNDSVWADWLYGQQYFLDPSGTQERESRVFVDVLSKMLGVPVMPPRG